jgi:hypothetical protein
MVLLSIRDVQTNNLKRLEADDDSTVDELRKNIKSLFRIQSLDTLMLHGREVRGGTLKSYNIVEGCLIEIVGQVEGA